MCRGFCGDKNKTESAYQACAVSREKASVVEVFHFHLAESKSSSKIASADGGNRVQVGFEARWPAAAELHCHADRWPHAQLEMNGSCRSTILKS